MSSIQGFFKYLKSDILILVQFSAVLIQLSGMFLINPEVFNLYENQDSLSAGNFEQYIAIIISIVLLYLATLFRGRKHLRKWSIVFVVTTASFCFTFFNYNSLIDNKTVMLSSPTSDVRYRIIKGNTFLPQVQQCVDAQFKETQVPMSDLEVIQNCCDIQSSSDIDKVWPKSEIIANRNSLYREYLISFLLGISSIVVGIQSIKCLKNRERN